MEKIKYILFIGIIFVAGILLFKPPVFAEEDYSGFTQALVKEGLTLDDFQKYTTYYYKNPDPDKLLLITKAFTSQDRYISNPEGFSAFKHFVASVAYNNTGFVSKLKELGKTSSGTQQLAMEKILGHLDNYQSPLADCTIYLDYLWAEFMATGSEEAVRKIISVLDIYVDRNNKHPTEQDLEDAILKNSAKWSLKSNAEQHEKVYRIVEQEAETATGIRKQELEEILGSIAENKRN